jgi:hypothetical protein
MTGTLISDGLVKIRAEITGNGKADGESFWAEPLGQGLYRLRNTPFYAFDLHFHDVVRAVAHAPGGLATISEVVERSGHKTLRIIFSERASTADVSAVLAELGRHKTTHERARGRLYALDVDVDADYAAVCTYLAELEGLGVLQYETGSTLPSSGLKPPSK